MTIGLIGTKLGMTREFIQSGQSIPVTVIKIEKGRVIDIIKNENRGYSAVQIGYFKTKNSKLTKQMKGFLQRKILNQKDCSRSTECQILKITRQEMNLV